MNGLYAGYSALPEDLIGENGLLKQLPKALVERALDAEGSAPRPRQERNVTHRQ